MIYNYLVHDIFQSINQREVEDYFYKSYNSKLCHVSVLLLGHYKL